MNPLWTYFWPTFGLGLLFGAVCGSIAFRRQKRQLFALIFGAVLSVAAAGLWHGPLGGATRFASQVERSARLTLNHYEMTQIKAHLHHAPLTRWLVLSGRADDFQTSELVRLMSQLPGVSRATWSESDRAVPLVGEGAAVSLLGFLIGLLLAYLVELRRRYNAQWNW
jgi:hypothetical protein